ncbi:MAG: sugar phosphate isomerase/epimerase, partial [Lachnospiraceae bacterium]|nr:sugar phosphate isomerase/epimerase [Lachnospiraceae bacterium]
LNSLKKILYSNGIKVDTIHFSFDLDNDDWENKMMETMKAANYLNAPIIVTHCTPFEIDESYYKKVLPKLLERILLLEKMCYEQNVKVALENLAPGYATIIVEKLLAVANPNLIGFCYDSSHDQIDGPRSVKLLEDWKNRLIATHISDRIKPFTDHVIPGEGFIKFDEIIRIMKTIKIEFPFLMEVETTHSQYIQEDEFLRNAYSAAYRLVKEINN